MVQKKEDVKDVVKAAASKAAVKTEETKAVTAKVPAKEEKAAVKVEPKKEEAVKEDAPKKRGRKPGSKNSTSTAKKSTAKKAAKKTTAKKSVGRPSSKKEGLAPEIYLQYNGGETVISDIVERIKQQFVNEGHRAGNMKSLQIYMKPEENAVYYVINEKNAGKVNIF